MDLESFYPENIAKRKNKDIKIKKIIDLIVIIILIPIILYNLLLIAQSILFPSKTPSVFGVKSYVVISGSMEPTINIGDVVIVKEQKKKEYEVDDIISFRQGQNIITHRITEVQVTDGNTFYITKGDNNNTEDSFSIDNDKVEGKVKFTIPKIGYISLLLEDHIVLVIVILILLSIIFSNIKKNVKKEKRHKKRKLYEEKKDI